MSWGSERISTFTSFQKASCSACLFCITTICIYGYNSIEFLFLPFHVKYLRFRQSQTHCLQFNSIFVIKAGFGDFILVNSRIYLTIIICLSSPNSTITPPSRPLHGSKKNWIWCILKIFFGSNSGVIDICDGFNGYEGDFDGFLSLVPIHKLLL